MRETPTLTFEQRFWNTGLTRVAGLDEAGRGAWAGPVAAAAVILPRRIRIAGELSGVRDSKQMTPRQRANWSGRIKAESEAWGVGLASSQEIDQLGILPATRLAMQRALEGLGCEPEHLLIDAVILKDVDVPQTALIHGDALVLSIAAASVLAKTARDELMVALDEQYPGYGFARHKGYGTAWHLQVLRDRGTLPIHRFSYAPIRNVRMGKV